MNFFHLFGTPGPDNSAPQKLPLDAIERRVDALSEFLQIKVPDEGRLDRDVQALLDNENKIAAIKLHRERYGTSLAEAKEMVESGGAGTPVLLRIEKKLDRVLQELGIQIPDVRPESDSPTVGMGGDAVEAAIRRGHMIEAIRIYRELNGTGLKDSKDAVDEMARRLKER